jgi:hypothetical protein
MLTKTQEKIMEIFISKINKKFSINEISILIKKPYALVYHSIKELINRRLVFIDEKKLLSLNIFSSPSDFIYVEALRLEERIRKHKSISFFIQDCLKDIKEDFFVFLIFGSFVEKDKFNDLDVLIVVDKANQIDSTEKVIEGIASRFSFKAHIIVIAKESVYEMFGKREERNIMNETLNKHLIVFGAENYYRFLKNVRK